METWKLCRALTFEILLCNCEQSGKKTPPELKALKRDFATGGAACTLIVANASKKPRRSSKFL